jgi:hypothetical protein
MTNVEPGLTVLVIGVRLTCDSAAHLAGESVAIKDVRAGFFGDPSLKSWARREACQHVLSGAKVGTIVMRKNLKSFLVAEFSQPPPPLAGSSHLAKCIGVQYLSNMPLKIRS